MVTTFNTSKKNRLSLRLGGLAGDGMQSTGLLLQKFFNSIGLYVFGFPGTQSTIRGGHVWQHVEISPLEITSYDQRLDLLIAFRDIALEVHIKDMKNQGIIIYNENQVSIDDYIDTINQNQLITIPLPMSTLAKGIDSRTKVLENSIAVGCLLSILNYDFNGYLKILKKKFKGRKSIIEMNKSALEKGVNFISQSYKISMNFSTDPINSSRIIISGNEMIALGAAASGMKFLAQYPITPASSILTYLAKISKKFGIVVRQAEDELAAISMIIGASYAGVRSMTASSGPGISLMSEAFGYASMTETPIVIVNAMRAGPSTGVPTKMEQADLNSGIHLSHGESPRVILAPRNVAECFKITVRAFNIADIYQVPVIILSDFALSERTESIEEFDLDVTIDRGKIWKAPSDDYPQFKRHQLTPDSISPRAFPPTPEAMYIAVGAEHDEYSHSLSGNRCGLPQSGLIREKMFEKRFAKLELIRDQMNPPDVFGIENADYTILCWGSTQGAVVETIKILNSQGQQWNAVCFSDIFPLPFDKLKPILQNIKFSIMFEVNYTGQLESLIHSHLNWRPDIRIHPLSGENPTASSIINSIEKKLEWRNKI